MTNQDQTYRKYLTKYASKFRTFKNEDSVYELKCSKKNPAINSSICVYNFPIKPEGENILLFSYITDFRSRIPTHCINKLKASGCWFEISQQGDSDICIKFLEKDLEKLSNIFMIRKKRQVTEQERARLKEIGIKKNGKAETKL